MTEGLMKGRTLYYPRTAPRIVDELLFPPLMISPFDKLWAESSQILYSLIHRFDRQPCFGRVSCGTAFVVHLTRKYLF